MLLVANKLRFHVLFCGPSNSSECGWVSHSFSLRRSNEPQTRQWVAWMMVWAVWTCAAIA